MSFTSHIFSHLAARAILSLKRRKKEGNRVKLEEQKEKNRAAEKEKEMELKQREIALAEAKQAEEAKDKEAMRKRDEMMFKLIGGRRFRPAGPDDQ